jgi:transposase
MEIDAYIPFKKGASEARGGVWAEKLRFFKKYPDEFDAKYHLRSNIETVNAMIKAKFHGEVRSKNEVARTNEVFAKALCHNICTVIRASYDPELQGDLLGDLHLKSRRMAA